MKNWLVCGVLLGLCVGCNSMPGGPPSLAERTQLPAAMQALPNLDGREIIRRTHRAAGGKIFTDPGTLFLTGYNIIRDERGGETIWDHYAMWRVFATEKSDAHAANGKLRIEAWSDEKLALLLAFDGEHTYDKNGRMNTSSAANMWSANFGFGAIRNALDSGWTQTRQTDRLIDGQPCFMVLLKDPAGGETLFGIRQRDHVIAYVGFETPRGWHERRYSHYFSKPGSSWQQAGRVRLFYSGRKSNEVVWTDFQIGRQYPQTLFVIDRPPDTPSF